MTHKCPSINGELIVDDDYCKSFALGTGCQHWNKKEKKCEFPDMVNKEIKK